MNQHIVLGLGEDGLVNASVRSLVYPGVGSRYAHTKFSDGSRRWLNTNGLWSFMPYETSERVNETLALVLREDN